MKKKNIIAACVALFMCSHVNAQTAQEDSTTTKYKELEQRVTALEEDALQERIWKRRKYFNIALVNQSVKDETADMKFDSKFGIALVKGTTYYLHRKPVANMIKFGLDWTQADLNYVKYKNMGLNDEISVLQAEYSMHLGPSVTINPIDYLLVNVYARYAPTFSFIYSNDDGDKTYNYNYVSFFVIGGALSYKTISLGVEARFGKNSYHTAEKSDNNNSGNYIDHSRNHFKTNSTRFYVSLRF